MNDMHETIAKGREVVRIEAGAVASLESRIGESFGRTVDLILNCRGRVVITGVGKSGIIARKIVATLNSTGTPSMFLHPSDAVHGDLGMVRSDDIVVCISKSGNTPELNSLLPLLKRIGIPIVSLVGRMGSKLALESTLVLDASVQEEACPHNLAPTSSTTVTLVLGDALAVALLGRRKFRKEDFAFYHPGGTLGRRLLLKVDEMMAADDAVPSVRGNVPLHEAIMEMTSKRLGCTCVVREDGTLEGILTDGDLRRLLQKGSDITGVTAGAAMTRHPKTIRHGTLAALALQEMEAYNITQIVVVDDDNRPAGVIHLHDLVKAGLGSDETS